MRVLFQRSLISAPALLLLIVKVPADDLEDALFCSPTSVNAHMTRLHQGAGGHGRKVAETRPLWPTLGISTCIRLWLTLYPPFSFSLNISLAIELCARVGYRLLSPPRAVTHCHCGQCRKSHGSAFASYGAVPRKDLCIVSGQSDIKSYASSASVHRQFCQHCGSSLFWSRQAGDWADWICIALGTLDSPFTASQQKHVRLDSRPLWSDFASGCMPPG